MECPDCDHITDVTDIEGKSVCTECGLAFGSSILVNHLPFADDAEKDDIAARIMCDTKEREPLDDVYSSFQDVTKNESRRIRDAYQDIDDATLNLFRDDTKSTLRLIWKTFSKDNNSYRLKRAPYMDALRYIGYVMEKNVSGMSTFYVGRGPVAKCINRLTTATTSVYAFPSKRDIHDIYMDAWLPIITTDPEVLRVLRRLCYRNIPISCGLEPRHIAARAIWDAYIDLTKNRSAITLMNAGIVKQTQAGFAKQIGITQSILSTNRRHPTASGPRMFQKVRSPKK
jgi:hypothetical protein